MSGLDAGKEIAAEFPTVILGAGPHTVKATVDVGGQVAESDESNNSREATCQV